MQSQCDNFNLKSHKHVCLTTHQQDTKSHINPNPNPNPATKQHAIVSIQLNTVTCPTYPDKFIRDNVVASSVLLSVVIVTLPNAKGGGWGWLQGMSVRVCVLVDLTDRELFNVSRCTRITCTSAATNKHKFTTNVCTICLSTKRMYNLSVYKRMYNLSVYKTYVQCVSKTSSYLYFE